MLWEMIRFQWRARAGQAIDLSILRRVFGPGSPWCPQQLVCRRILIQLLRKSKRTLRPKGMGACKLVKNEAMLDRWLVTIR